MRDYNPKGILPALITPFTTEGKVNEKSLRRLINYVEKGNVHGIFVIGTTGEFYGLNREQRREIIEISLDEVQGRLPVHVGTGAITTRESVELTQLAEECGCQAVSVLTPMFINPSQDQLYEHYKNIAQNTSLPVILYNNFPKTGVNITPETVNKLARLDNIVGIKDSSGDFTLTTEYMRATKEQKFNVLAGRDTHIHACLCYGGSGAVAACANVAPGLVAEIYDKYISGDLKGSLEAQYRIAPLRIAFNLGTFPAVIKEALQLIGIDAGLCLAPVKPMSLEEREKLKIILIEMGLLA